MPTAQIQPYLFFDGRCAEAVEFYRHAVGAKVTMLMRYKDAPPSSGGATPLVDPEKIMHCNLRIGDSEILASDGDSHGQPEFKGFRLSLTVPDERAAGCAFKALSEGGTVNMPLAKTFFSPSFGMLKDRFGVGWMVYVVRQPARTSKAKPKIKARKRAKSAGKKRGGRARSPG